MSPLKSLTINEFVFVFLFLHPCLFYPSYSVSVCDSPSGRRHESYLQAGLWWWVVVVVFVVVVVGFFPNGTGTKSNNKKKGRKE